MDHNKPKADQQPTELTLQFLLGQLTAKVDLLLSNQKAYDARHDALETRVTVLEKDKAKLLGAAVVISALLGLLLNYINLQ